MLTIVLAILAVALFAFGLSRARRPGSLALACALLASAFLMLHAAHAAYADVGSGSAVVDAGSGSGSGSQAGIATSPPSDAAGIFGRIVQDWHDGKLIDALLVGLFALVLVLRAWVPWLTKGRRATIVAAVLAALTTGITTLVSKSVTFEWLEGMIGAGLLLYLHPNPTQNAEAKAAAAGP